MVNPILTHGNVLLWECKTIIKIPPNMKGRSRTTSEMPRQPFLALGSIIRPIRENYLFFLSTQVPATCGTKLCQSLTPCFPTDVLVNYYRPSNDRCFFVSIIVLKSRVLRTFNSSVIALSIHPTCPLKVLLYSVHVLSRQGHIYLQVWKFFRAWAPLL